jgi:hypothetical protein
MIKSKEVFSKPIGSDALTINNQIAVDKLLLELRQAFSKHYNCDYYVGTNFSINGDTLLCQASGDPQYWYPPTSFKKINANDNRYKLSLLDLLDDKTYACKGVQAILDNHLNQLSDKYAALFQNSKPDFQEQDSVLLQSMKYQGVFISDILDDYNIAYTVVKDDKIVYFEAANYKYDQGAKIFVKNSGYHLLMSKIESFSQDGYEERFASYKQAQNFIKRFGNYHITNRLADGQIAIKFSSWFNDFQELAKIITKYQQSHKSWLNLFVQGMQQEMNRIECGQDMEKYDANYAKVVVSSQDVIEFANWADAYYYNDASMVGQS